MSANDTVCCLKVKTVEISHYARALPCHYQTQNSLIHFTALHAVFQISICRENCIPTAVVSHQTIRQGSPYTKNCRSHEQPPWMAVGILGHLAVS